MRHPPFTIPLQPTIGSTVDLMRWLHWGQVDKSGVPYWTHPYRVAGRLPANATEEQRQAALLHDVMEDCGVTEEELGLWGYSAFTVGAIVTLTRRLDETYAQFIERIAQHPAVIPVKLADIEDNLSPERAAGRPKGIERRYLKAQSRLAAALAWYDQQAEIAKNTHARGMKIAERAMGNYSETLTELAKGPSK